VFHHHVWFDYFDRLIRPGKTGAAGRHAGSATFHGLVGGNQYRRHALANAVIQYIESDSRTLAQRVPLERRNANAIHVHAAG